MPDAMNPVIVIPAFNRPQALARLLKSIDRAEYPRPVKLVISIEGDAPESVHLIANNFSSKSIEVEVIQRPQRLGLKDHILACSDLAMKYGSAILLEDDLIVDRYFYFYASTALTHYAKESTIAGIGLYAYEINDYAKVPFRPVYNGYSTYPMQVPCSWGQCWSAEQWRTFRNWYDDTNSITHSDLPSAVTGWPESSWKKYFAAYLVEYERYFIYPYLTYTTNCSDPGGAHLISGTDMKQVALGSQNRARPTFTFCPTSDPDVAYDAFMEPCGTSVYSELGLTRHDVEIDMLGIKPTEVLKRKPYTLTRKPVSHYIRQYPRSFRPIENNLSQPLDTPRTDALSLAKSVDVINSSGFQRSLSEYNYFAGMDIGSNPVISTIMKSRALTLLARIKRFITIKLP